MSFFDTLQQMGLFKSGQQAAQPQQNPYGLDQQAMRQVGWQTLGNIGSQIMALSQQMTPAQRAAMMARADFTGGMQQNLFNAAQMKLMADRRQRTAQEDDRTKAATAWLTQRVVGMPDGAQKQNAMIYLQLGDVAKAAEVLTAAGKQPEYQIVDGYRVERDNPNAPAIPIAGLPGEPPETPKPSDRMALYTDFEKSPEALSYNVLAATLGSLAGAIDDNSKVSDLDFVYGVAKALDPTSVVRESEGQMVVDSQGLAPSLLGRINGLVGGGQLTPEKRRELFALVRRRAGEYYKQAETRRAQTLRIGRGIINEDDLRALPPLIDLPPLAVTPQSVAPGRTGRLDAVPEPELLRVE